MIIGATFNINSNKLSPTTNNFFLTAKDNVFLFKNRWPVETFFKYIKGYLRIKSFLAILRMRFRYRFIWH